MGHLTVLAVGLFASAVFAKLVYVVVKTIRIAVLRIDPPMVGFDSEPPMEAAIEEIQGENAPEVVDDEVAAPPLALTT